MSRILSKPIVKKLQTAFLPGESYLPNIRLSRLHFSVLLILVGCLLTSGCESWNAVAKSNRAEPSASSSTTTPALPSGSLTRHAGNPLIPNGPDSYDLYKTGPRVVLKEGPNKYSMWYEAVYGANKAYVGYATSTDGFSWTKQGVVLKPSEPWEGGINGEISPNSILVEGNTYKLWYHSYSNGNRRIGYATARRAGYAAYNSKFLKWTKHPTPVLDLGAPNSFDDYMVVEPRVFKAGNQYRMYYGAMRASQQGVGVYRLMMATSADGINWTKSPNPLFGPLDSGYAIIFDNGVWNMWFGRSSQGLGYAWSTDGISWQEGPNAMVLNVNSNANAPDSVGVGDSVSVYKDGNTYRILYTGLRGYDPTTNSWPEAICMATVASQ